MKRSGDCAQEIEAAKAEEKAGTEEEAAATSFERWLHTIEVEPWVIEMMKEDGMDTFEDLHEVLQDLATLERYAMAPVERERLLRLAPAAITTARSTGGNAAAIEVARAAMLTEAEEAEEEKAAKADALTATDRSEAETAKATTKIHAIQRRKLTRRKITADKATAAEEAQKKPPNDPARSRLGNMLASLLGTNSDSDEERTEEEEEELKLWRRLRKKYMLKENETARAEEKADTEDTEEEKAAKVNTVTATDGSEAETAKATMKIQAIQRGKLTRRKIAAEKAIAAAEAQKKLPNDPARSGMDNILAILLNTDSDSDEEKTEEEEEKLKATATAVEKATDTSEEIVKAAKMVQTIQLGKLKRRNVATKKATTAALETVKKADATAKVDGKPEKVMTKKAKVVLVNVDKIYT
jgi:hypothetical protein